MACPCASGCCTAPRSRRRFIGDRKRLRHERAALVSQHDRNLHVSQHEKRGIRAGTAMGRELHKAGLCISPQSGGPAALRPGRRPLMRDVIAPGEKVNVNTRPQRRHQRRKLLQGTQDSGVEERARRHARRVARIPKPFFRTALLTGWYCTGTGTSTNRLY
jgi:hypothetical protein